MGYLPTVDDAALTGKVAEQLALPDPRPKLVQPDYAYTTKVQAEMQDWWDKNVAACLSRAAEQRGAAQSRCWGPPRC